MGIVRAGGINANLAPDAFRKWAQHYYECKQTFRVADRFSPVPYFLLCRAIELHLKSQYLGAKSQEWLKDHFNHNLEAMYDQLPSASKMLSTEELKLLRRANAIYKEKEFEYFKPQDALTAFKRYPDLSKLDGLAKKLLRLSCLTRGVSDPGVNKRG
jgi:hypothetical protein